MQMDMPRLGFLRTAGIVSEWDGGCCPWAGPGDR